MTTRKKHPAAGAAGAFIDLTPWAKNRGRLEILRTISPDDSFTVEVQAIAGALRAFSAMRAALRSNAEIRDQLQDLRNLIGGEFIKGGIKKGQRAKGLADRLEDIDQGPAGSTIRFALAKAGANDPIFGFGNFGEMVAQLRQLDLLFARALQEIDHSQGKRGQNYADARAAALELIHVFKSHKLPLKYTPSISKKQRDYPPLMRCLALVLLEDSELRESFEKADKKRRSSPDAAHRFASDRLAELSEIIRQSRTAP